MERCPRSARATRTTRTTRGALVGLSLVASVLPACTPYRIEYHRRPDYYREMSDSRLQDQVTLDDGTVLVFSKDGKQRQNATAGPPAEKIELRKVADGGDVVLRSLMPEHVVAHVLTSIRREEYDLLWDQVLSERTRMAYEAEGGGYEGFLDFMYDHERDLARMFTRMSLSLRTTDVVRQKLGGGVTRLQFRPQVIYSRDGSRIFGEFDGIDVIREEFEVKLLRIH